MSAQNQGEGAYEAELFVVVPPQADFIGVVRNSEVKFQLSSLASYVSGLAVEVHGRGSGGGFYTSVLKQSIEKMIRFFQAQRLYNT